MSAVSRARAQQVASPTLLDFEAADHIARFLAIVESIPPRTRFTVNDLRDRLDAAAIPERSRGGLISTAKSAGLIEVCTVTGWGRQQPERVPSTGASAHRATVLVYRRTAPGDTQDPTPADTAAGDATVAPSGGAS